MKSLEKIYVFVNEVGMDVSVKQVYIKFIGLRKKRDKLKNGKKLEIEIILYGYCK